MNDIIEMSSASHPEPEYEPIEVQSCPRCGSSADFEDCSEFGCEDGVIDRYEEDPLWYGFANDSERYETCTMCLGKGGWWRCMSAYEWCQAHPLPGCENVRRAS